MICENVIGSLRDEDVHHELAKRLGGYVVEEVLFSWDECHKRVQRKVGSEGTEVGIRLSEEAQRRGIRDNDVLGIDDFTQHVLVARIKEESALIIQVDEHDVFAAARIAWAVGNTHAPLFAAKHTGCFATSPNEPLRSLLSRMPGVEVRAGRMPLDPGRQISAGFSVPGHAHGHNHAADADCKHPASHSVASSVSREDGPR